MDDYFKRIFISTICPAICFLLLSLVNDGILSPQDVDSVLTDGLALRWSFIGPFETIDMNAPGGLKDYCERYTPAIHDCVDNMVKTN